MCRGLKAPIENRHPLIIGTHVTRTTPLPVYVTHTLIGIGKLSYAVVGMYSHKPHPSVLRVKASALWNKKGHSRVYSCFLQ